MKKISSVLSTLLLSACVTSTVVYQPPQSPDKVPTSTTINDSFDTVWGRTIENISETFFNINNVEKQSELINISFATNNPEDYIDCGTTKRTFKNMRGESIYNYKSAEDARFTYQTKNGFVLNVTRTTSAKITANIYLKPYNGITKIKTNVMYNLIKSDRFSAGGYNTHTNNLTSKNPYTKSSEGNDYKCISNGKLEKLILDTAKKQ